MPRMEPAVVDDGAIVEGSGDLTFSEETQHNDASFHPCKFALLLILVVVPLTAWTLLFGAMGNGIEVNEALHRRSGRSAALMSASLLVFFLYYILDARHWQRGALRLLRFALLAVGWAGGMVAMALSVRAYPIAPAVLLFLLALPYCCLLFLTVYTQADVHTFAAHLSKSLLATAAGILLLWLRWIFLAGGLGGGGHPWDPPEQARIMAALGCAAEGGLRTADGSVDPASVCYTSAHFLWLGPFLFAVVCAVFAAVLHILAGVVSPAVDTRRTVRTGRIIVSLFGFLVLLLWIAMSLAAAGTKLASYVVVVAFFLAIEAAVSVGFVIGWDKMRAPVKRSARDGLIATLGSSNWVRAIALLSFAPVLPLLLLISVSNQAVRKLTKVNLREGDEALALTRTFHLQWVYVRDNWPWTEVLWNACSFCVGVVVMIVGVLNGTSILLSALNDYLRSFALAQTCAIYMAVGLTMFLCPVVPGVPVYITGGIVVTAAAEPSMGFAGGMVLASLVGWMTKMMSVWVQHAGIGARCGQSVAIRQFVAINSVNTRAMRLTLEPPGLNLRKVCILVGGPDWPTTVMTGILGLPVSQMLLGSTPVILLIAPTVMAGAFLLKPPTDTFASSMQSVMLATATLVQGAALMAAFYFISEVANTREEEIRALELDEAVAAADRVTARQAAKLKAAMDWRRPGFPAAIRLLLALATALCAVPAYAVVLVPEKCFISFAVSDSIAEKLDGEIANMILRLGWACLAMSLAGWAMLKVFTTWLSCAVRRFPDPDGEVPENPTAVAEAMHGSGNSGNKSTKKGIKVVV